MGSTYQFGIQRFFIVLKKLAKSLDFPHFLQWIEGEIIGPPAYFVTILADERFGGQTSKLEGIEIDGAYPFACKGHTGELVRAENPLPDALEANGQDAIDTLCLKQRLQRFWERIMEIICWFRQVKGTNLIFKGAT